MKQIIRHFCECCNSGNVDEISISMQVIIPINQEFNRRLIDDDDYANRLALRFARRYKIPLWDYDKQAYIAGDFS